MGRVRDCLLSLFRKDGASPASRRTDSITIQRPPVSKRISAGKHNSEQSQCTVFEMPLPYGDYEAYNNTSRQYINTGAAHIFKTFPSDALMPLEDEGIGRLKAFYEAWFPKNGSVTRDRVNGLYTLALVNSSCCEGTIHCGNTSISCSLRKHHAQCMYAGTGVRRGCGTAGNSPCTGIELWIKGSLPVTGPWVQDMYIPPDERLNKLCLIAAPKPNSMSCINTGNSLVELPDLVAGPAHRVFELDSDVYIYICRLSPCSSITYTAAAAAKRTSEPPMYECSRLHRATTTLCHEHTVRRRKRHRSPKLGTTRSLFIHVYSDITKDGHTRTGGARLLLPGSIHLANGDAVHLKKVTPGADINIKSTGFDRAQFILIDMPGYQDDDDTRSI
ncbi:hypothetical protein LPJ77_005868, partial [Coemansia sp. RSA 2523]